MRRAALGMSAICLLWAMLACTSNDTLFIQLTATPIPSLTPTVAVIDARYKSGARLTYVALSSPATLRREADLNSGSAGQCFTGTQVTVTEARRIGTGTYYRVMCASAVGWTAENTLTALRVGGVALISTDVYPTNDPEADTPAALNRAAKEPCKTGATVSILEVAISRVDGGLYASVQCGSAVGWLPEAVLQVGL